MQKVANRVPMSQQDFHQKGQFTIHWLGSAGILMNYYGTTILIDPVLDQVEVDGQYWNRQDDLIMFNQVPIHLCEIPKVDGILYTHGDEDHIGEQSFKMLAQTGSAIYCTSHVKSIFAAAGVDEGQINVVSSHTRFQIGPIEIECTKALHDWPQKVGANIFKYSLDDCVGYLLKTPKQTLWHPGDTKLLDEHLHYSSLDVIFIDFADDPYHFGFENAVMLSNHYKDAQLFAIHWGTYKSEKAALNGNPVEAHHRIKQPERLIIPSIGGKFCL